MITLRFDPEVLLAYMDETWAFIGMSPTYGWVSMDAIRHPIDAKEQYGSTGPAAPANRGRRAIVLHAMTRFGGVPGAERVWITGKDDVNGRDYHW
jgi:hypothetical protein